MECLSIGFTTDTTGKLVASVPILTLTIKIIEEQNEWKDYDESKEKTDQ